MESIHAKLSTERAGNEGKGHSRPPADRSRYAIWRLLNDQVPEVQHLLETAHVPNLTAHLKDHLNQMSETYIEESLDPAVAPLARCGVEQRESLRMRLQRRVREILSFLMP